MKTLTLAAAATLAALVSLPRANTTEPAAPEAARWEGTYLLYDQYDTKREGQFAEARKVTITRDGDGYKLSSKPYDGYKFFEKTKGVLSDTKDVLGKIYFGSAEFADGKRARVLRVEFCYEYFILYDQTTEPAKKPAAGAARPQSLPVNEPAGFKLAAPLNRGGPQLTVEVIPQVLASNWLYTLHITSTDGLDQSLTVRNGQPLTAKDVRLVDVSADGFVDLMVVGGQDSQGDNWYKTWLYDGKSKQFRWINNR